MSTVPSWMDKSKLRIPGYIDTGTRQTLEQLLSRLTYIKDRINYIPVVNDDGTIVVNDDGHQVKTAAFFGNLVTPESLDLEIGVAVQAYDPTLDALAGLEGPGLVALTSEDAAIMRTATGTALEIAVANGDGDTGNPTFSFPDPLSFAGKTIQDLGTVTTANIDGGTIDGTTIGASSDTTGKFTTVQSTITTGTAPLIIASTTMVSNLNADLLDGNEASAFQPVDADLTSIAALGTAADKMLYTTAADTWAEAAITAAGRALLDDAAASNQRTTLGLGTIATQAANNVSISGGAVTGITDLVVADGGTGLSATTAYAVLCGGTTATAALQSIAAVGAAGEVLTSNGAGALPTFQAGGAGTIGGSTEAVDNAVLLADGVGGATVQASGVIVDDSNNVSGINLLSVETGTNNCFVGATSGDSLTDGTNNTCLGHNAGTAIAGADKNVAVGSLAGAFISSGGANTAVGYKALYIVQTTTNNTAVGYEAGKSCTGTGNTIVGSSSGAGAMSGGNNTCLGYLSGTGITSGSNNTVAGRQAGATITTQDDNTHYGYYAGAASTANGNTCLGTNSGRSTSSGGANTFVGSGAGRTNSTAESNTAVGNSANYTGNGSFNTDVGLDASRSRTSGTYGCAFGYKAGRTITEGHRNNYFGGWAGYSITTGDDNIAIGYEAGYSNATGDKSVCIGYQAGYNETASNQLYIAHSNTATPLIHGDFGTAVLTVNGALTVTGLITGVAASPISFNMLTAPISDSGGTWTTYASDALGAEYNGYVYNSTTADADWFEVAMYVPPGTYTIRMGIHYALNRGVVDVYVDGNEEGSFDMEGAADYLNTEQIAGLAITGGATVLKFVLDGTTGTDNIFTIGAIEFWRTA